MGILQEYCINLKNSAWNSHTKLTISTLCGIIGIIIMDITYKLRFMLYVQYTLKYSKKNHKVSHVSSKLKKYVVIWIWNRCKSQYDLRRRWFLFDSNKWHINGARSMQDSDDRNLLKEYN